MENLGQEDTRGEGKGMQKRVRTQHAPKLRGEELAVDLRFGCEEAVVGVPLLLIAVLAVQR